MSKRARIICFLIWLILILIGAIGYGLNLIPSDYIYHWGFILGTFSFGFLTLAIEGGRDR